MYFNPETGKSFDSGPNEGPQAGWRKLQPISSPTPSLPPGSTVTWIFEGLILDTDPIRAAEQAFAALTGSEPNWGMATIRDNYGPI